MTTTVRAVYSQGVFRPVTPISIADGTEVELTIATDAPATNGTDLIAALQRIASLPLEGRNDGFSGADHDTVLYRGEDR